MELQQNLDLDDHPQARKKIVAVEDWWLLYSYIINIDKGNPK